MSDGKRPISNITQHDLRVRLFAIWCIALVLYFCGSLSLIAKDGIGFGDAFSIAWQFAYIIVPVLGAFGGYWFGPHADDSAARSSKVPAWRVNIAYAITFVPHLLVVVVFILAIVIEDFGVDRVPDPAQAFKERTGYLLQTFWLVWSVSLLPVGWLVQGFSPPEPPGS